MRLSGIRHYTAIQCCVKKIHYLNTRNHLKPGKILRSLLAYAQRPCSGLGILSGQLVLHRSWAQHVRWTDERSPRLTSHFRPNARSFSNHKSKFTNLLYRSLLTYAQGHAQDLEYPCHEYSHRSWAWHVRRPAASEWICSYVNLNEVIGVWLYLKYNRATQ